MRPVFLVDQPFWLGEVHRYIRESLRDEGFRVIEFPPDAWLQSEVAADHQVPTLDYNRIIRPSLERSLATEYGEVSREEITTRFLNCGRYFAAEFQQLILRERPIAAIVVNGYLAQQRIAATLMHQASGHVLALENSFANDRFYWETETGSIGNRHGMDGTFWERLRHVALSELETKQLQGFLLSRDTSHSFDSMIVQPSPTAKADVRRILGLDASTRYALILGQIPYDSVVVDDSAGYDSLIEFIYAAVDAVVATNSHVAVIRTHPKESQEYGDHTAKILRDKYAHNHRIRVVSGQEINTYSLMDDADFGITLNSQSGLEFLTRGRNLVVGGHAYYGYKGFTIDAPQRNFLGVAVDTAVRHPVLSSSQEEIFKRFLYSLLFRYMCPYDRPSVRSRLTQTIDKWRINQGESAMPIYTTTHPEMMSSVSVDNPFFSVILPVHNASTYLPETLARLSQQNENSWECLIVDDGSHDNSLAIATQWASQRPNKVRVLQHPGKSNHGVAASRNLALAVARGQWVAFLDADDVWLPSKLSCQRKFIEANPNVEIVGTRINPILTEDVEATVKTAVHDWADKMSDFEDSLDALARVSRLLSGNPFCISTVTVKKDAILSVSGFTETLMYQFEDWLLWCKLAVEHRMAIIKDTLVLYRWTPGGFSASLKNRDAESAARAEMLWHYFRWLESQPNYLDVYRTLSRSYADEIWIRPGDVLQSVEKYRSYLDQLKQSPLGQVAYRFHEVPGLRCLGRILRKVSD
jgi:glycosyltransferase involved in cell wall biosynthesis